MNRHRLVAAVGVILSVLAVVAWGLTATRTYQATTSLLVTQEGQPFGRSTLDEGRVERQPDGTKQLTPRFADPSRMEYLARFYARLAGSDEVRRLARADRPTIGQYWATVGRSDDGATLPIIDVGAMGPDAITAAASANTVARALKRSLEVTQVRGHVPVEERVRLDVITVAKPANAVAPGRRTRAMMLFLLGLALTGLIVAVLENARLDRSPELAITHDEEPLPIAAARDAAAGGAIARSVRDTERPPSGDTLRAIANGRERRPRPASLGSRAEDVARDL